jgi:3-oxoacyl-[acyl-carrier protein] reductase
VDQAGLKNRVVLLTGGSGGIGQALGRRLAGAGAHLAIGYANHAAPAEDLAGWARSEGVNACAIGADLSDPTSALDLLEQAEASLGPVDVLIPNAGLGESRPLAMIDRGLWSRTMAVNLEAPFLLAQRLAPQMAGRGWGRVLFVSSVAAFTGGVVGPHYAASKAGLQGLVGWFSHEFAGRGVTVNAIAPALITGTAMLPDGAAPKPPVGRLGTPDEVADLALAMVTNGYLSGKVYLLDGGIHPH